MFRDNKEKEGFPDPFADKVKCDECKHWIDKSDAQQVSCTGLYNFIRSYCPLHKKPYSKVTKWSHPYRYFGELEMNEEGIPIGYEPVKVKKPPTPPGEK